ncbi:MAG: carbon monoxide dehydrogenase, partial [Desulfobacca sp.]|nr:carbon monoxide dehydrogenase [Desulfobacca sp.]
MNPHYISPSSLEEAQDHLKRKGEKTRLLAGGTDVMIALRTARLGGASFSEFLLDISALLELKEIFVSEHQVVIGAGVPFRELETHPQLLKKVPLLTSAASRVGSV